MRYQGLIGHAKRSIEPDVLIERDQSAVNKYKLWKFLEYKDPGLFTNPEK